MRYKPRACVSCGETFAPKWSGSRYCSVRCQLAAHTRIASNGCIEWTGNQHTFGYGCVRIDGKTRRAHVVAWELENGPVPKGLFVLHECDNPVCINPAHLHPGTPKRNVEEMQSRGRVAVGAKLPHTKLSEMDVREVRLMLERGALQREIAEQFGVHRITISQIKTGKTFKWL